MVLFVLGNYSDLRIYLHSGHLLLVSYSKSECLALADFSLYCSLKFSFIFWIPITFIYGEFWYKSAARTVAISIAVPSMQLVSVSRSPPARVAMDIAAFSDVSSPCSLSKTDASRVHQLFLPLTGKTCGIPRLVQPKWELRMWSLVMARLELSLYFNIPVNERNILYIIYIISIWNEKWIKAKGRWWRS